MSEWVLLILVCNLLCLPASWGSNNTGAGVGSGIANTMAKSMAKIAKMDALGAITGGRNQVHFGELDVCGRCGSFNFIRNGCHLIRPDRNTGGWFASKMQSPPYQLGVQHAASYHLAVRPSFRFWPTHCGMRAHDQKWRRVAPYGQETFQNYVHRFLMSL